MSLGAAGGGLDHCTVSYPQLVVEKSLQMLNKLSL